MSTVLYEWKLYERVESLNEDGDTITVEVEDVDLHLKTTTSIRNANIALKENTLDLGKNYVLRVAAWQPGATSGIENKLLLYLYIHILLFINTGKEMASKSKIT